jgi:hypothetical protein
LISDIRKQATTTAEKQRDKCAAVCDNGGALHVCMIMYIHILSRSAHTDAVVHWHTVVLRN